MEIDVMRPQFMPAEMVEHWRTLQAASPGLGSPFLSPHWPRAIERAQQGADRGLRVAVLHEGGRPRGYLAVRGEGGAAMAPGAPLCAYQGLVAEPGISLDPRRLVRSLNIGCLDFGHMLETMEAFTPYARGRSDNLAVELTQGYDAYVANLDEAGAAILREQEETRGRAEAEAGGVTFTPWSRVSADLDRLFSWKRDQARDTGGADVFASEWTARLVRELFESRDPDFGGVLFTLHIGDRLAAAQFHLRGRSVLHTMMSGQNAGLERYAPGRQITQRILHWMDDTPFRRLELGQGDDPVARELCNRRQGVMHGFVGVPSPAAFVRGAQYGLRRAAESLKLGKVSDMPARAMEKHDLRRSLR